MTIGPEQLPGVVRQWLFDVALPLWADRGVDHEGGGFTERLDLAAAAPENPFKRMRVQARQIYVFSHAHLLGWSGPGLDLATRAFEFIAKNGWLPGRGWARVLSRQGDVVDDTLDLYDQAFVLYALGWFIKASGDQRAVRLAKESLAAVHANLRHPTGEGYMHVKPPVEPWQQNPHMHMLEAALSLCQATGDAEYFDEARALAKLFRTRFYEAESQTLAEYYDAAWSRAPGALGKITEPGHQFEWSWLLYEYTALTGDNFNAEAKGLYDFAERYGVDATTKLTVDEVRDDGEILKASVRSWPQTEALKANIAVMRNHGLDRRVRAAGIVANLFDYFLDKPIPGVWVDHLEADRRTPKVKIIPASTLYHVFLAYSEVLRHAALFAGAAS